MQTSAVQQLILVAVTIFQPAYIFGCIGLDTFVISVDYATEPKSLSIQAVSSLGECLAICKNTSHCLAANFYSVRSSTSPVCELLASKQSEVESKINASSSIFKMYYAERTCLPVAPPMCNSSAWIFEKVPQTVLQDIKSLSSSILDIRKNASPQECLTQCLQTEYCGAAVIRKSGSSSNYPDCQLLEVSRHSVRNPDHFFKSNSSFDLYENNCRNESILEFDQPKTGCAFSNERFRVRSSVRLYDQRMNGIGNSEECQSLCSSFRQAPCRLYAFDRRQNSCYLSHSRFGMDSEADGNIGVSLDAVASSDVTTAELDDCVQFELYCSPVAMTVNVSTARMFRGTFGVLPSDKPECKMTVDNEQRFQLKLDYGECEVRKEKSGFYATTVSLKYGTTQLLTYKDRRVKLVCRHTTDSQDEISVATHLNVKNVSTSEPSVIAGPQPIPIGIGEYDLKILDSSLQPAKRVQPGQEGYLEVMQVGLKFGDPRLPKDIRITNLVASSMHSGEEVLLLDEVGCSMQKELIKPFEPVDFARTWRARIRYFAFNDTSNIVRFSGLVKPCLGRCAGFDTKCKSGDKPEKSFPIRIRRDNIAAATGSRGAPQTAVGEVIVLNPKT